MGNECSSNAVSQQAPRTWYSLYKDAESTYEIDTRANDESSESLYSGKSDDLDDESSSDDGSCCCADPSNQRVTLGSAVLNVFHVVFACE